MIENNHLYMQIAQKIREDINNKVYIPGDLLPSEEEFTKIFDASRTTIRNAMSFLEKEGFVSKHQGKGTIVRDLNITNNLNYIYSLTDLLVERGYKVTTNLLSIKKMLPTPRISEKLQLEQPEEVYWIQRSRSADGIPVAYQNNYILAKIAPDLEEKKHLLKGQGLYNILETEYGLEITDSIESIEMYMSGTLEKDILQLPSDLPLFLSNRTTWLTDGTLFEYVTTIIRSDMVSYKVRLKNRKQPFP